MTAAAGALKWGRRVGRTPSGRRGQPQRDVGVIFVDKTNVAGFCHGLGPATAEMLESRDSGMSVRGGASRYLSRQDYY